MRVSVIYCVGISSLYFVVTGTQYWACSYFTTALSSSALTVNALFIVCTATGPTSGVLFGGWIIDNVFGGYRGNSQRTGALEVCCVFGKLHHPSHPW